MKSVEGSRWICINHEWQAEIMWSLAHGPVANQMPGSFPPWFPLAIAMCRMWEILSSHENTHTHTKLQAVKGKSCRVSQHVMKRRTLKISSTSLVRLLIHSRNDPVVMRSGSWAHVHCRKESCGSVDSSPETEILTGTQPLVSRLTSTSPKTSKQHVFLTFLPVECQGRSANRLMWMWWEMLEFILRSHIFRANASTVWDTV